MLALEGLAYENRRVIEMLATEPSSPGATECLLRCLQRHATHRPLQVTEVSLILVYNRCLCAAAETPQRRLLLLSC